MTAVQKAGLLVPKTVDKMALTMAGKMADLKAVLMVASRDAMSAALMAEQKAAEMVVRMVGLSALTMVDMKVVLLAEWTAEWTAVSRAEQMVGYSVDKRVVWMRGT